MAESNTVSIFREDYKKYSDYLKDYRRLCLYHGYKVRVVGGWKFFTFKQDYDIWKNQK